MSMCNAIFILPDRNGGSFNLEVCQLEQIENHDRNMTRRKISWYAYTVNNTAYTAYIQEEIVCNLEANHSIREL